MPELPEVEVVRSGLARWVLGSTIESVDVVDPRSLRKHLPGPEHFADSLSNLTVLDAVRRGKYLWLVLGDAGNHGGDAGRGNAGSTRSGYASGAVGPALLAHLGMSGQLLLQPKAAPAEKHLRVGVSFAGSDVQLRFVDQRIFGSMQLTELVSTADAGPGGCGETPSPLLPDPVAHIARDPLDPQFDDAAFARRLRAKHTGVKRALLDQGLVSGIGNIYADEALWQARLHYARPTETLNRPTIARLLDAVRHVLRDALAAGGTSFDSLYVNVNGESGYFSRDLNVYGLAGHPCKRCGTAIVREKFMNRSSYFCPRCQRKR